MGDFDADLDLEEELLSLVGEGAGSVRRLRSLCSKIAKSCTGVPQHVRETAEIKDDTHRERCLHAWARRQPWAALVSKPYDFGMPITLDGVHEEEGTHSCVLPFDVFFSVSSAPELFRDLFTHSEERLQDFWDKSPTTEWYRHHR